jgi:hypothetical protein
MAWASRPWADIFDTDQGSQFTGRASPWVLANNKFAISIDGKGLGATTSSSKGCAAAYLPTGSGSRVGTLRTLLLSGCPADDRTVNYLTSLTGARSRGSYLPISTPSSSQPPDRRGVQ